MHMFNLLLRMHFGEPYAGKPHVRFCGGGQLVTTVFTSQYDKRGLLKLIKLVLSNKVSRLLLTHRDRLLRFGSQLLFNICEYFNVEVEIIEDCTELSFEQNASLTI